MKLKSRPRRILVYGDSNTWGSDGSGKGLRYETAKQWPNLLSAQLGGDYEVIQEGLCGRIAGNHDEQDLHRNGHVGYEIALRSASPFDYLIVALGTNDLKLKYQLTPQEIIDDLLRYRDRTNQYNQIDNDMENRFKKVIYINIANFKPNEHVDVAQSEEVKKLMRESGEIVIELDDLEHSADGLHFSEADHKKVATKVAMQLKELGSEI